MRDDISEPADRSAGLSCAFDAARRQIVISSGPEELNDVGLRLLDDGLDPLGHMRQFCERNNDGWPVPKELHVAVTALEAIRDRSPLAAELLTLSDEPAPTPFS